MNICDTWRKMLIRLKFTKPLRKTDGEYQRGFAIYIFMPEDKLLINFLK